MIVAGEWRSGSGDCRGGEVVIAKRIAIKISLRANEGNKIVGVIISGRSVKYSSGAINAVAVHFAVH